VDSVQTIDLPLQPPYQAQAHRGSNYATHLDVRRKHQKLQMELEHRRRQRQGLVLVAMPAQLAYLVLGRSNLVVLENRNLGTFVVLLVHSVAGQWEDSGRDPRGLVIVGGL
jgi:hypothetical protein